MIDSEIFVDDPNATLVNLTDNSYQTIYTVLVKSSTAVLVDCKRPVLLTGYLLSGRIENNQDLMKFTVNSSKAYHAFQLRVESTAGCSNFQLLRWQLFGEDAIISTAP